jgi:hypothetical protein
MSYNGSGTFNINTAGQPVVTGTSISSSVFNALTADLATGLSTAITKDGQTATTARIPFAQGISSTLVTDSTSTTTGSIITAGGAGIAKALFVGTTANVAGAVTLQSTLGVTGVTTVQAGTAALPAITTTGDTNTGIFFPAADTIAFAEGGAEVMRISSAGNVGIGATSLTQFNLRISNNITGSTSSQVVRADGTVQSDVTSEAIYFNARTQTAAAAFTLTDLVAYGVSQGTIGAGSTVTNQYAYKVDSSITGATNNYGFYGNIASGTGRYNFYANGTADNYFAGNVGIGTTAPVTKLNLIDALSGGQLLVATNQTNATEKYGTFGTQHYTNAEEPVLGMAVQSNATDNSILIGGALGEFNAATQVRFYTAANNTTVSGSERMRITSAGDVGIATSSPRVRLDVRSDAVIAAPTPLANAVASGVFAIGDSVGSVVGLQQNGSSYDTYIQSRNMGAGSAAYNLLLQPLGGNVGIGTSSPASKLDINTGGSSGTQDLITLSGLDSASTKQTYATIRMGIEDGTAGSEDGNLHLQTVESGTVRDRIFMKGGGEIAFSNGGTERARITSAGDLLVGTTANPTGYRLYVTGTNDRGMQIDAPSGSGVYTTLNFAQNGSTQTQLFWFSTTDEFIIQNTSAGVKLTNGATSWASASDERLKDIIEPITNAAEKVSSLRAVVGKYKTDAEGKRRTFLIAQDVQAVLPEAVYSAQQARTEDETEYLHLQYTDVIPLLVAAIKEQQALITALTTRITALEST